jgi:mannose-1-phosphate guanylyltransferase
MKNKFIPVIISGGSSSRLFPLSRELTPKPFLTLLNNSNNGTLFYNTVQRCLLLNPDELYTVTLQDLAELTLDELDKLSKKDYDSVTFNFILENKGFDTAAAFSLAILDCYLKNPDPSRSCRTYFR